MGRLGHWGRQVKWGEGQGRVGGQRGQPRSLQMHTPQERVSAPGEFTALCVAESLQSCPTLCDPMGCNPPGSSVHGILQARILEQVTMPSSRGFSPPRDRTLVSPASCIGRQVLYVVPK